MITRHPIQTVLAVWALGVLVVWTTIFLFPPYIVQPLREPKIVAWASGKCLNYVKNDLAPGQHVIMSAAKWNHIAEILAVCEAGKDPSKVAFKDVTKGDTDVALRSAIEAQTRCGGVPCPKHTQ